MIRKLTKQMLTAQILSALTVSLCLLIDSVMIGRFLGVEAIAAYQLANPILLVIGALGSMLAAGIQVVCSRSLGRGSQKDTNVGYSSAVALTLGVSVLLTVLVLVFRSPLATAMGAGREGGLFDQTKGYLAGFIIGAPASMGALILVPFMQLAGKNKLLIAAVLSMTVADVALDLINVFVVHGGMFGMGLASSLSYYAALIIGGFYFLSKKCVFRFSLSDVKKSKIAELFSSGVPAVFNMASGVVMIFILNKILLGTGGSDAVAAFSVIMTLGNTSNCVSTGIGGVSLTLAGIFYNEEDRSGLKELAANLGRYSVILGAAVGILMAVFAPQLVKLFITSAGKIRDMAGLGVRIFAVGLIPRCINNALKNAYQVMDRVRLTEGISILQCAVFPVLAAFLLSRFLGTTGVWFFFLMGELLTILGICLYVHRRTGSAPWKNDAFLLLRDDFSVPPDRLMETELHTIEEVTAAAQEAEQFCRKHGQNARITNYIALCIEEMAGNTILHGFTKDRKPHHLSVRVLYKEDAWILRFRDDCGSFDPVSYIPHGEKDALGIRLVLAIAEEARYTHSLDLNNLMLKLPVT
ncbi:MAG: hypothetical protein IKE57_03990 [Oscillospiraceae bacterium]|nr:hypothetical protein [Oscillospiraceae bacterium]